MMKYKKVIRGSSIKVSGIVKKKSVTGKALNKGNPVTGRRPTKKSKAIKHSNVYKRKMKK